MTEFRFSGNSADLEPSKPARTAGFGIAELLVALVLLSVASASVFSVLGEVQREASYQAETQAVLNNTRVAMQVIARYVRQAGNDPTGTGIQGITPISATEIRIVSDVKGSAGPGNPDKGDPDGDAGDSDENVLIRLNPRTRSIEVVHGQGSAQLIAGYISNLRFQYYNENGEITADGKRVSRIAITVSGSSLMPNPRTGRIFGITLEGSARILT